MDDEREKATREKAESVYDRIAQAGKKMGLDVRNGLFEGY
jgi:hypothetical protein